MGPVVYDTSKLLLLLSTYCKNVDDAIGGKREALNTDDVDQWQMLALARFQLIKAVSALVNFKHDILLPFVKANGKNNEVNCAERLVAANRISRQRYIAFTERSQLTQKRSVTESYKCEAGQLMAYLHEVVVTDLRLFTNLIQAIGSGTAFDHAS